jgi:hypothetical protein
VGPPTRSNHSCTTRASQWFVNDSYRFVSGLRARITEAEIPARGGPRGARTHNQRIKRVQDCDHCGLYLRLCHHRVPHRPNRTTMVDVISCHEPCHARCSSSRTREVAGRLTAHVDRRVGPAGVAAAERRSRGLGRRLATRVVASAMLVPGRSNVIRCAHPAKTGSHGRVALPQRRPRGLNQRLSSLLPVMVRQVTERSMRRPGEDRGAGTA